MKLVVFRRRGWTCFFFFFTLVTGPRRSVSLELSDTRVYEPQIRARLGRRGWTCGPGARTLCHTHDFFRILVYLVIYDSGQVSLEHLLLSRNPSQRGLWHLKKLVVFCRRGWTCGPGGRTRPPPPRNGRTLNRRTSLIRKRTPLGPYRRHMPRVLGGS